MRRSGSLCGLLLTPVSAVAADTAGNADFSLAAGFLQMLASLALVIGVIFVVYYISCRWLKITPTARGVSRYIRVVETRFLAPKKSLLLVEVSGEYLLLSNSGDGLQLVKQIDMLEEIEVVEERPRAAQVSAQVRDRLAALTAGVPSRLMRYVPIQKKHGEAL